MARGPALTLAARIDERVAARRGAVWTPVDFLELGPRAAVDKALQRLTDDGRLTRVSRGLYFRPGQNRLTGKPTTPGVRSIVDAVARRDQSRILVDGLTAANDLGLTTAVPARVTVLTDARLRPIQVGNQRITFRTVAPSRLYWAERPAMRVVQALHWCQDLVEGGGTPVLSRLRVVLNDQVHGRAIRDDLRKGMHTLPAWIQTVVRRLLADGDGVRGAGSPTRTRHAKSREARASTRSTRRRLSR